MAANGVHFQDSTGQWLIKLLLEQKQSLSDEFDHITMQTSLLNGNESFKKP